MAVKIVVLDGNAVHPEQGGWDFLNVYGEVTVYPYDVPEDLLLRCKDADIALTNKVVFTQESLAQLPKLKLIAVVATGYNVVDCTAARAQGITVCNVPAYSTDSVAQMTWAHILQITNRVGYYAQCNREGRWSKSPNFCYCDFPIP